MRNGNLAVYVEGHASPRGKEILQAQARWDAAFECDESNESESEYCIEEGADENGVALPGEEQKAEIVYCHGNFEEYGARNVEGLFGGNELQEK